MGSCQMGVSSCEEVMKCVADDMHVHTYDHTHCPTRAARVCLPRSIDRSIQRVCGHGANATTLEMRSINRSMRRQARIRRRHRTRPNVNQRGFVMRVHAPSQKHARAHTHSRTVPIDQPHTQHRQTTRMAAAASSAAAAAGPNGPINNDDNSDPWGRFQARVQGMVLAVVGLASIFTARHIPCPLRTLAGTLASVGFDVVTLRCVRPSCLPIFDSIQVDACLVQRTDPSPFYTSLLCPTNAGCCTPSPHAPSRSPTTSRTPAPPTYVRTTGINNNRSIDQSEMALP